jgi:hypothetical protein
MAKKAEKQSVEIIKVNSLDDLEKGMMVRTDKASIVKTFGADALTFSYNGKVTGNTCSVDLANVEVWGIGWAEKGQRFYNFPIANSSDTDDRKLALEYVREARRNMANGVTEKTDEEKRAMLSKRYTKEELQRLLEGM